jgi:hypothetical protein
MSKVMEATAFYPSGEGGASKMGQCIDTGLPVFSRDCGTGGEKAFFACGYEHFVYNLYRRPYMRHVYEVLQWDRPTKVYFDFDRYVAADEDYAEVRAKFDGLVKGFVAHVSKDIVERWNYETAPEVVTMEASTEKKLSVHVVFQFYLSGVGNMKDYYNFLVSTYTFESTEDASIVDDGVYTRNRSFRLLYSSKYGKTNALRIVNQDDDEYSPRDVIRSMIQVMAPDHYKGPLRWARGAVHTFAGGSPVGGKRGRTESGGVYIPPSSLPDGVVYYIKEKGGVIRGGRREDNFMSYIVSGMMCPWIGDKHKSNNTYFTINTKTGNSWLRCADNDCKPLHYCKVNLKWAF